MEEISCYLFDILENNKYNKIALIFAAPACIPFSIGRMIKGHLFKYQMLFYITEPSNESNKIYYTKALCDFKI